MTEISQRRSVAAASLVAAALVCCLLAGSLGNRRTALSVRGKEMSRTRQLEQESARETALARLEAKRVQALEKELKSIHLKARRVTANANQHAKQILQNIDKEIHEKGAGYWDKEHHDDVFVPVVDMSRRLGARMSEWEGEEKEKQPLNQLDAFVDDAAVEAPVVKTANAILTLNSQEQEFEDDDTFVPPPSEITPSHRVPTQAYLPWEESTTQFMSNLLTASSI